MEPSAIFGQSTGNRVRFRSRLRFPLFNRTPARVISVRFDFAVNRGSIKAFDDGNRMFVLGMGYVGRFFAQQLKSEGWVVSGTCRSTQKKKELEQMGFNIHLFDAASPEWRILDTCKKFTHLLVSIPPTVDVSDPIHQLKEIPMHKLAGGDLQWLCYLSSTSVYGNYEAAWVNEDCAPKPSTKASQMRLEAEELWLKLANSLDIPAYVLRLAGIYGPGRSAIDTILKQQRLSESQKKRVSKQFTSRVHVQDICQAIRACISVQPIRNIYNIADDDPSGRDQVFAYARQLIEEKWPGYIGSMDLLATTPRRILSAEKRVLNVRMKEDLGVKLHHPCYRSGLKEIIDHMEHPNHSWRT